MLLNFKDQFVNDQNRKTQGQSLNVAGDTRKDTKNFYAASF